MPVLITDSLLAETNERKFLLTGLMWSCLHAHSTRVMRVSGGGGKQQVKGVSGGTQQVGGVCRGVHVSPPACEATQCSEKVVSNTQFLSSVYRTAGPHPHENMWLGDFVSFGHSIKNKEPLRTPKNMGLLRFH